MLMIKTLKFIIYFITLWEKEPGEYQIIWDYSGGNTEEAEVEWFYEDLQDLLELTPKKDVIFTEQKHQQPPCHSSQKRASKMTPTR